jgi:hypothetical protein
VNDTVEMTFSIYPDTLGSPADWSETQTQVIVENGIFNVLLGAVDTIPQAVFDGNVKYLGVQVESDPEMTPLKPMVSVPYAYRAASADGVGGGGGWVDDGSVVRLETDTDQVGIGTASPEANLDVNDRIRVAGDWARIELLSAPNTVAGRIWQGGSGNVVIDAPAGAGNVVLATQGGGRLNVKQDGTVYTHSTSNVGIGTESPAEKLDVRGNMSVYDISSMQNQFDITNASGYGITISNENVGIGTENPKAKLDVSGGIKGAPKTDSPSLSNALPLPDSVAYGVNASYSTDGGGMFAWYQGTSDHTDLAIWYGDDQNADLRFLRGQWDGTYQDLTDVMTLAANGNVGIGTTEPGAKLDVAGPVNTSSSYSIDGITVLQTPELFPAVGNTFVGLYSGNVIFPSMSYHGTFVGYKAGDTNEGTNNTFVGSEAGRYHTTGGTNTFIGKSAGQNNVTGSGNVFLGYGAGLSETGSNKLYISNTGSSALISGDFSTGRVIIDGRLGVDTDPLANKFEVRGNIGIRSEGANQIVLELGEGLDYAEGFDVTDERQVGPGAVLIIDPTNPGKLAISHKPYDSKVAGIVAGANGQGSGVRLGADQFDFDVALAGRVYCNVDASEAGVQPGDLLTTSATPGYAMKVTDYARAQGSILGKAMQKLEKGKKGQILVLVTLQ